MGGRAGGGARGGGASAGINYDYTGGFAKAPFKGAAQIKSLQVGDVLGTTNGPTSEYFSKVVKIDKLSKSKWIVTTNTAGQSSHVVVNPKHYVNGIKVNPSNWEK